MSSSTIDGRFEELSYGYLQFCAESRKAPFLTTISKATIGWPDKQQYPNGQWSKGHVTVSIGDYFGSWAAQQDFSHDNDDMLRLCRDANVMVGTCFRMLYERDLWLNRNDASVISSLALSFLDAYRRLAKMARDRSRNLFSLMPKAHAFEEIFYEIKHELRQKPQMQWILNPLVHSVQISEDWVGRCSRVSRRLSPAQVIVRCLQRTLKAYYAHYKDHGYLFD